MPNLEDMQKELQQMGESVRRMQDSVAELARGQAQAREARAGEAREAVFAAAERKGAAYPLAGHVMEKADQKDKEAYLSLLLFTWSLLAPEAEESEAGLVTAARIRESIHVATPLYMLFCHMKEKSDADLGAWITAVNRAGGINACLLDTLFLCQEMKAESNSAYGKLSQLYALLGYKVDRLKEAGEAMSLILGGDRQSYLLKESHSWKSFDGRAGECYLDLVGDLNTPGQEASTSYYALWPERKEGATDTPKYSPAVMLKVEAAEGTMVEKGQTLFTLYGASEAYGEEAIEAIFVCAARMLLRPQECILTGYETFTVKAEMDGILRWKFKPGKNSLFYRPGTVRGYSRESKNHAAWEKENFYISSPSMTPGTIGNTPLCVIEKM